MSNTNAFIKAILQGPPGFRAYPGGKLDGGLSFHGMSKQSWNGHASSLKLSPEEEARGAAFITAVVKGTDGISCLTTTHGLNVLWEFATTVGRNPVGLESTVITVGYGGSEESTLSLRAPAYVLPAIGLVRALRGANLPTPRIRVVVARQMAVTVNERNHSLVTENAERTFEVLRSFLAAFAPDVLPLVDFTYDDNVLEDSTEVVEVLRDAMRAEAQTEGCFSEVCETLRRQAVSRSNGHALEKALHYGALHPVLFGDLLSTRSAISIGGPPERNFNYMRCWAEYWVRNSGLPIAQSERSLKLLTGVGQTPVYYPGSGDARLDRVSRHRWELLVLDPSVRRDYEEIARYVSPASYLAWANGV